MINKLNELLSKIHFFTRMKGSAYIDQDRVLEIDEGEQSILGSVKGSGGNVYRVLISATTKGVSSICTCPVGKKCKHVAAVLLAYLAFPKERVNGQKVVKFPTSSLEVNKTEEIGHLATKRWLAEIISAQGQSAKAQPEKSVNPSDRTLVFNLTLSNDKAIINFHSVLMKKKGGYAKTNRLVVDIKNLWSYSSQEAKDSFTDDDWEIIQYVQRNGVDTNYEGVTLNFPGSGKILKTIIETGKCFFGDGYDYPLSWGESVSAHFEWQLDTENKEQRLVAVLENNKEILRGLNPTCYFDRARQSVGFLLFKEDHSLIEALLKAPAVPFKEVNKLRKALVNKVESLAQLAPREIREKTIQTPPKPVVRFFVAEFLSHYWNASPEEAVCASVSFKYGDQTVSYSTGPEKRTTISDNQGNIIYIDRDLELEEEFIDFLYEDLGWDTPPSHYRDVSSYFVFDFFKNKQEALNSAIYIFDNDVPILQHEGWEIEIDPSFPIKGIYASEEILLDANEESAGERESNDWFDVKLGVMIEGERINLLPFLKQISKALQEEDEQVEIDPTETLSVLTEDGRCIKLPKHSLARLARHLMLEFDNDEIIDPNKLTVSKWNAGFLTEFLNGENAAKIRWTGPEELKVFAETLKQQRGYGEVDLPEGLKCELRPYQKDGVNWLQFLNHCGLNGVLADDMGLGKTVQTLTHILIEKESGRMKLPAIIIAPTSLMPNWFNEASRFTPSLKVLVLHGNDRKAYFDQVHTYDLILTTYPLLMRDKEFLISQEFHLMILDEAQIVKNFKTQAYQIVQQIKANQRICLSGTPMENHLGELWSLFHLLMPGFLGDRKTFHSIYRKPIEKKGNLKRREALTKRIKPFMLRRTKQEVALDLPEKNEIIQTIELKDKQRNLYEAIRLRAQSKVMKEIEKKGLAGSQIIVLDALLKLRQVCCDPRLVKTDHGLKAKESAKLDWLMETIPQMVEENRKILLFSQFTSMLALIEEALNELKIPYTLLTGETKDRRTPVENFQSGQVPIMLISLKAGGVGLNLTAADTVIHYDPWWNPSVESQATDRAHRIGQKQTVFVYKLVAAGSLEEKILDLQNRKRELTSAILNAGGGASKQFSLEDLEDIFKPLPQPI